MIYINIFSNSCEMSLTICISLADKVLPPAQSNSRKRGGLQSPVPYLYCSRSPAVVWQNWTRPGLHRYKNNGSVVYNIWKCMEYQITAVSICRMKHGNDQMETSTSIFLLLPWNSLHGCKIQEPLILHSTVVFVCVLRQIAHGSVYLHETELMLVLVLSKQQPHDSCS